MEKVLFTNFSVNINDVGFYEIEIFGDKEFGFKELDQLRSTQVKMGSLQLPVIVICGDYSSTDSDFMKYLAKNANNPYSKADAFIIKSMSQRILGNFYLNAIKPERPTRLFSKKEDAYKWIKQFF